MYILSMNQPASQPNSQPTNQPLRGRQTWFATNACYASGAANAKVALRDTASRRTAAQPRPAPATPPHT